MKHYFIYLMLLPVLAFAQAGCTPAHSPALPPTSIPTITSPTPIPITETLPPSPLIPTAIPQSEPTLNSPTPVPTTLTPTPQTLESLLSSLEPITAANANQIKQLAIWKTNHPTRSMAISADGSLIAAGLDEGLIRVWEVKSGKLRFTLRGHTKAIFGVAFSPDGLTLASASDDYTLKQWQLSDGSLLRTLSGFEDGVIAVAYSPDNKWLAGGSYDFSIRMWKANEQGAPRLMNVKNSFVSALEFSPNRKFLATVSNNWKDVLYSVTLWQVFNNKEIRTLRGIGERINDLAFSHDGNLLATVSGSEINVNDTSDKTVKIWNITDGKIIRSLEEQVLPLTSVLFTNDDSTIASASTDGDIKLWNTQEGNLLNTLAGSDSGIINLALSSDGKLLISAARDGSIEFWGKTK